MKETLKQIIEQAGDSALSQHIPLTAELIADRIIGSGIVPNDKNPFDRYIVIHRCQGTEMDIKNGFADLGTAVSFVQQLKDFIQFDRIRLYGVHEEHTLLTTWQCGTQPQREVSE